MRFIVVFCLLLSGCGTQTIFTPQTVEIPVTVPCKMPKIEKPEFPPISAEDSLFTQAKGLLSEIELRKGYEVQLETAIAACHD